LTEVFLVISKFRVGQWQKISKQLTFMHQKY
jgi:hypothetical protein